MKIHVFQSTAGVLHFIQGDMVDEHYLFGAIPVNIMVRDHANYTEVRRHFPFFVALVRSVMPHSKYLRPCLST